MTERIEQRICIKFCQKLDYSCSETVNMISKVYEDESMCASKIRKWFNRFEDGRISVESNPRSGRPVTVRTPENVERVRIAINKNRSLTAQKLEEELGIPKSIIFKILKHDLAMSRVATKFVPRYLTQLQRDYRVEVAEDYLETIRNNPDFLKKVITGVETLVYGYDPETKAESSQWQTVEEQRKKKARHSRNDVQIMLIVFFDHKGIVHHEYAPQDQTINKEYYLQILKRLQDEVRRKRPYLWENADWLLHHDSTPVHSSHIIHDFLTKHGISQVRQPPYSSDIAPCDFWLFPKLENFLKEKRFYDAKDIKWNVSKQLLDIPEAEFQNCFKKWKQRWEKVVISKGEYLKKI